MSLTRRHFIETASLTLLASAACPTVFAQSASGAKDGTFSAENLSLLEDVTEETFKPYIGDSFAVSEGSRSMGSLVLHSVAPAPLPPSPPKQPMVGQVPPPSNQAVDGFSLQFKGSGTSLHQGTYTLKNTRLGNVSLFIVPGGQKTSPHTYTAVFSLLAQ
jgi:hypothetical protein